MSKGLKIANKIANLASKHATKPKGKKLSDDEIESVDNPKEESMEKEEKKPNPFAKKKKI